MVRSNFLRLTEYAKGFKVVKVRGLRKKVPPGVRGDTLSGLWDIAAKFGQVVDETAITYSQSGLIIDLSIHKEGKFMAVTSEASDTRIHDAFSFNLKNGVHVIWDKKVSGQQAREMITMADNIAASSDKSSDSGTLFSVEKGSQRMNVAEIFKGGDRLKILVTYERNAEDILPLFDCPEELAVVDFGLVKIVCLKPDEETVLAFGAKRTCDRLLPDTKDIPGWDDALRCRMENQAIDRIE